MEVFLTPMTTVLELEGNHHGVLIGSQGPFFPKDLEVIYVAGSESQLFDSGDNHWQVANAPGNITVSYQIQVTNQRCGSRRKTSWEEEWN